MITCTVKKVKLNILFNLTYNFPFLFLFLLLIGKLILVIFYWRLFRVSKTSTLFYVKPFLFDFLSINQQAMILENKKK